MNGSGCGDVCWTPHVPPIVVGEPIHPHRTTGKGMRTMEYVSTMPKDSCPPNRNYTSRWTGRGCLFRIRCGEPYAPLGFSAASPRPGHGSTIAAARTLQGCAKLEYGCPPRRGAPPR